jgi:hypothetical protein
MSKPLFEEIQPPRVEQTRPDPKQSDFASLLSRIYRITDSAVGELELTDDPGRIKSLKNKISALHSLSRTLPLLQHAESLTHVRAKDGKVLTDWTTDELRDAYAEMQARSK